MSKRERPSQKTKHHLKIGWSKSLSFGGYTSCSLTVDRRWVASCGGRGYDMRGVVVGQWVQKRFRDRLLRLSEHFYGLNFYAPDGDSSPTPTKQHTLPLIDGKCGFESVINILRAVGGQIKQVKIADADRYVVKVERRWRPAVS